VLRPPDEYADEPEQRPPNSSFFFLRASWMVCSSFLVLENWLRWL